MILDKPRHSHYDLVIIGSGPAGITTALSFAERSSARVAIIESGLQEAHEKIQTLSAVELTGELQHDYFPMHTQRCFGGSSTIWGGFCATLEKRAFMAQSWPIEYSEIERWYPAAARILELPEAAYRAPSVPIQGSSRIVYRPFYLSPPVRFNKKYRREIAQHERVDLILNNTCTRLIKRGGQLTEVELVASLGSGDSPTTLRGDRFVLACGGVGNPRLLQLSGLAGSMPVGAGLMEHPHLYGVGKVYLDRQRLKEVVEQKARVVHALQLSNDYCIDKGVLSFSADFNLSETRSGPLLGKQRTLALTPVSVRAEMQPYPSNRVSLGDKQDYLGQPRSKVDFRFHCERPANRCWDLFGEALLESGLGRASPLAEELKPDGGGHLLGTTPMGRDKANSVVDRDCRVHGMANLYVAGSSVFPAGGASNPTYTIVAMSLRLAHHLTANEQGRAQTRELNG